MTDKKSILLIHPPLAKVCEPPAGIARLAGALKRSGEDCRVYDANLDGILDLARQPFRVNDTWSKRAFKHIEKNLCALRSHETYACMDHYKRAVTDVNRVIHVAGRSFDTDLSLANYTTPKLSPARSDDLLESARQFKIHFISVFKNG